MLGLNHCTNDKRASFWKLVFRLGWQQKTNICTKYLTSNFRPIVQLAVLTFCEKLKKKHFDYHRDELLCPLKRSILFGTKMYWKLKVQKHKRIELN